MKLGSFSAKSLLFGRSSDGPKQVSGIAVGANVGYLVMVGTGVGELVGEGEGAYCCDEMISCKYGVVRY